MYLFDWYGACKHIFDKSDSKLNLYQNFIYLIFISMVNLFCLQKVVEYTGNTYD